jgi:hypothetical protein
VSTSSLCIQGQAFLPLSSHQPVPHPPSLRGHCRTENRLGSK